MAIKSFGDRAAERFFFTGKRPRGAGWVSIAKIVKRKLDMLNYASKLFELREIPGNRLEALRGELLGSHSIRINDQWRLVFQWADGEASNVRIVDYH